MLSLKQNFYYTASTIALIALAACSSDSPSTADSTATPNEIAETSSSSEIPITSSADDTIESSSSKTTTILSNRKFIIAPNTENLEVSDEERAILDSLAKAFPQKSTTDQIDGMTRFINYDAQYNFTTPKERYTIPEEDDPNFCTIEEYKEETGLIRSVITSSFRTLQTTMLLTSDNSIAYLAYGEIGSSVETVKNLFQAECEANNGSFYDYYPYAEMVAVACTVKNFTGIPFETIVSEQQSLCDNDYKNF